MYNLSIEGLIWRFYLMMLAVIVPFYLGYGIFALIALPILLTAMFGMSFRHARKSSSNPVTQKEKGVSAVAE
jgi:hypothetical protein